MRFSSPMMTSRFRKPISPSMQTTFLPSDARATAMLATAVVLPTPPLPEVTVITFAAILYSVNLVSMVPPAGGHLSNARFLAGFFRAFQEQQLSRQRRAIAWETYPERRR